MKNNSVKLQWTSSMTFYGAAILTTICIVLGLSSNIMMMGAVAVSAFYIAVSTSETAVAFMFYLLPFANVFKFGWGSTSIITYIQLIVILKLFLSNRKIGGRFIYVWLLLVIWQVAGSQLQVLVLIKQMIVPITVYMVLKNCRIDTVRITKSLAIGLLVSSLIGQAKDFIPVLDNYLEDVRAYEISGIVYRFTGLSNDPNHYGSISILVTIGLICLLFNKKLDYKWLIVVGILVLFGLDTVSKSYFLMLCVVVVLVLLMFLKKKKYKWFFACVAALMLVLAMVVVGRIDMFNYMLQRLTNTTDITTGRTGRWVRYLQKLFSEPVHLLFGYGIAAEILDKVAHNTVLDLIFYYGLFGSVLYLYPYFLIIGRKNSSDIFHIAPLICFLMMAFFLSYLMYYDLAFNLIYVIAFMRDGKLPARMALGNGNKPA